MLRRILAIIVGSGVGVALAITTTMVVRHLWPAYVLAEPTKAYSLAMLCARLAVGAVCLVAAAWVATRVARDTGTAAWWLGGVVLAVSLWDHLVRVWADYPAWYHLVYLSYLLPLAVLSGRVASRRSRVSPAEG
jgi:hypothetical protein